MRVACEIWLHRDRAEARAGQRLKGALDLSTEELILLRQVADHVGLAISAVAERIRRHPETIANLKRWAATKRSKLH